MTAGRVLLVLVALVGGFAVGSGCSAQEERPIMRPIDHYREPAAVRPVEALDEEKGWGEKIGEIGTAILAVAAIGASIALPFLLI